MATNKTKIASDNLNEWLASTGFLFPKNEIELTRFEKLYKEEEQKYNGCKINPRNIIEGIITAPKKIIPLSKKEEEDYSHFKMVARNGEALPNHILAKMKKNQEKENKATDDDSKKKNK